MNKQNSPGNPGLQEQARVGGLLTAIMAESLKYSLENYKSTLHKQAVLVANHVRLHGCYPQGPLNVDCFTPKLQVEVGLWQAKTARSRGKTYGTPQALLVNTPWFPTYARELRKSDMDAAAAYAQLDKLRQIYVVNTNDTLKLRNFKRPVNDTAGSIASEVTTTGDLIVYGGDTCYKERRAFPNANLTNVEKGDALKPVAGVKSVVAVNSLTQKGTLGPEEIMLATNTDSVVAVVPRTRPQEIKRAQRYDRWAKLDDEHKMQRYLSMAQDSCAPTINSGENSVLFFFRPAIVQLDTTNYVPKTFTMRMSKSPGTGSQTGYCRPKIDGVHHLLVSRDGKVELYPRDITQGREKETLYATGRCAVSFAASLEYANGRLHVTRVHSYGTLRPTHENYQACQQFEQNVTLYLDGKKLPYCQEICKCPIDGVIVLARGKTHFFKETAEKDVKVDVGIDMVNFVTHVKHQDGSVELLKRQIWRFLPKSYQEDFQVTIDPSLVVPNWTQYKKSRPRCMQLNVELPDVKGVSLAPPGGTNCDLCKTIAKGFECEHGKFCHAHFCDSCWGADGIKCHSCDSPAQECPYGPPHCARSAHVCKQVHEAYA